MGTALNPLFVTVGANIAGFVTGMAKVQARTIATRKVIETASKLAGFALIGLGVIVAVKLAGSFVKAAESAQKALAIIRRGTGATGKALQVLKRDFDAVFGTVPEDAETVATAIADLNTRLELTGRPLQRMSRLFLDFARIAGEDVGETIRRTTRVFGDWSVATSKQEDVMNLLLRASQNSGVAITELSTKLVQFGAPLRQVGFTLEESVALLAKWEKEGVNVEAILGSLKISIGRFATAGEDAGQAFKRALTDITEVETEAEAAAIALDTVGSRAMADFAAAVREGRFDIEDFQKALEENTDTIKDAAKESETTAERIATAFNKIEKAFAPLGEQLIPVIEGGAGALSFLAENIGLVVAGFTTLIGLKVGSILGTWSRGLQTLGQGATAASVAVGILQGAVLGFVIGNAFKAVIDFIGSQAFKNAMRELTDITIGGELLRSLSDLRSKSKKELQGLVKDVAEEIKRLQLVLSKERRGFEVIARGVKFGFLSPKLLEESRNKIDAMASRLGFLAKSLVKVTRASENATDAVGKPEGLAAALEEVEEIVPPLIANITNLFAAINRGIEEQALRGMQEFLDFLAQGARLGTTGAFFGTGGGGTVIGGGLTSFFGTELPQTFVRGWNLVVGPALTKLPAGTKSSLSADMGDAFIDGFQGAMKNIQDIWKAVTVGLGQAFSVALSKELGTGFWGTFLSSVGGSLISSAIGFIFGGGKKVDLGLPTFAEAQELLAEKAREAAEALASIKDEIADTNVSIFRTKLSLDQFRDSLQEARKAQRDAARAIKAVGDEFAIAQQRTFRLTGGGAKTEIVGTLTGGEALAELQRLIDAAIGTGKLGFISRREQKEILELVQGTENEILAKQLVEAAAATALIRADFELQKLQLKNLRKTRQFARDTLTEMTSVVDAVDRSKDAIVDAIENIPRFQTGTRFVPQTGLAIVHRGEQIIPAGGERGAAGVDAGGGRPTSLTANIFLDGKLVESVVIPVMEDAIASRETSIRVNTRERRG